MSYLSKTVRQQVINEARKRCEYCQTSSRLTGMPLVIDHVIPLSLGCSNDRQNLAASCYRCNEFKGAKIEAIDPVTRELVTLFNPRQSNWQEHFIWVNNGIHIMGLTPSGRATVIALRLNNEDLVEARMIWIELNLHPPSDESNFVS